MTTKFNWPIIGHKPIVNYLQAMIGNNTLGHAYLFYGPNGLGKNTLAQYFIKSIYCRSDNSPCDHCAHCRQISKQIHPDIIYLDCQPGKKNVTIEQVREARAKIYRGTFLNSHKIIFIRDAQTLSLAAANGLLKILEEPTAKTIFIFLTPTLKSIPKTILSRVQVIKFLPVAVKKFESYLIKKGLDKNQAYELAHLSQGYPGRVLPFLGHSKLLTEYKYSQQNLLSQMSADLNSRFALVEKLAGQVKSEQSQQNAYQFLAQISSLVRDGLLIKNFCFDKVTHVNLKSELANFSSRYSSSHLAQLLNKIKITGRYLEQNVNLRLALENLVLEF
ncbi:hypothetical protein CO134_02885 [Candidatus Kuenenbacteria bacterium CG_4_9_14_3_um_filter_39_14]|uniref:DNA polymerase III subunit delta' n=7 Tax=Candidatus Kueneniibacteriota TaxID=1752740 RepID=A0A2M7ILK0_9BACT|nr:MAG: hypothetical protein AUK13_02225 [Candidatus Kuenenbacteria bacterium CG2_30_39_24]PIP28885.1 MAG: hypothetical protein COX28_02175 [Candidatus Kuenenbacteria bacterium CG23_combo_of_CG06-09_8_20_14_all_39_39]PIP75992.1 MAG: hypothetical protein COW86_00640 [Candidatus Kuenenbacteria bacterium CG22_combo_CG10-13_8_21_14_all_39_9]PIR81170.1 MAG: hypothetical protein COU24_00045 [Candidatus Kuenenbacteria bacterium CG10_big_fil_rev_8_21_14_0_10_39_14]PIW95660.1 MAG: hypothetical protein C